MTDKVKNRLRDKILRSRSRLTCEYPFFAVLLMYLKFVAVTDIKKISTDGVGVFFSPQYLDKLREYELDYLLCHQVMHIVNGDIWSESEGETYHWACDILLNVKLEELGFNLSSCTHLGFLHSEIPVGVSAEGLSAEEIFLRLPYDLRIFDERLKNRYLADGSDCWNGKYRVGKDAVTVLEANSLDSFFKDPVSGGEENAEGLKEAWKTLALSVAGELKKSPSLGKGEQSLFMKRIIEGVSKPKADWKNILNSFIRQNVSDYSFTPPDRRFSDSEYFLPDFNEKDVAETDILFMVDTSSSVESEALSRVYSEILGAIELFNGKINGKIGFFDVEVIPPVRSFCSKDELLNIIPVGGGGTDFECVFDFLEESSKEYLPACLVVFTDGECDYPDEKRAMGVPVLWIISDPENTPPWGRVVRIS